MTFDQLRRVLHQLGIHPLPIPNEKGWLHIACPYAPWLHRGGVDRSKGFAIKVEDTGISAFKCPACKTHGRISGLARGLGSYRQKDYDDIATEADQYDVLGATIPAFDDQFAAVAPPEPLDEALFSGLFDPVADFKEARKFMVGRRVSRATCEKLEIEFDKDKRRIVFPVRDGEGRLYGWSGRTVITDHKPRILDYAGLPKRILILGEHRWRPDKPKMLVEGLFAYARLHEIGAEELVDIGALLGSTLTEEKAAILKRHGCTVIPLMDPDKAGDECLFGTWTDPVIDQHTGEVMTAGYFAGGGLIDILADEIPVALPYFPEGVTDVDDLTLEQVSQVLATTQLQGQSQRWLDKKSKLR